MNAAQGAVFLATGLLVCFLGQVFTNIGIRMYTKGKTDHG